MALVVALVFGGAATAEASDEPVGWAYQISHELMSPFCPGRTLAQCSSPQAAELRQWIIFQEAGGLSRDEVLETLFQRYGDTIRQIPRAEGWGLGAFGIPIAGFVIGGVVLVVVLRRLVRPSSPSEGAPAASPATAGAAAADPELERLLDEDLALL